MTIVDLDGLPATPDVRNYVRFFACAARSDCSFPRSDTLFFHCIDIWIHQAEWRGSLPEQNHKISHYSILQALFLPLALRVYGVNFSSYVQEHLFYPLSYDK